MGGDEFFTLFDLAVPEQADPRGSEGGDDENFWQDPIPRKTRKTVAEKVLPTDAECITPKKSPRSKKKFEDWSLDEKAPSHNILSISPKHANESDDRSSTERFSMDMAKGRSRARYEKTPPVTPRNRNNSKDNTLVVGETRTSSRSSSVSSRSSSFSSAAPPVSSAVHATQIVVKPPSMKVEQKQADPKPAKLMLELSNFAIFRQFLLQPLPPGFLLQCVITRQKGAGLFNRYPLFELHLDAEMGTLAGKLLMCAKRQTGNKTSNYHISMDRVNFDANCKSYLGKVRSNFLGNEYVIYDDGIAPAKAGTIERGDKNVRQELGAVQYMPSLVASQPRELQVILPLPGSKEHGLLSRFKNEKSNKNNITILQQKKPRWNEANQAYGLNFHGRVKCASVKNFVLINSGNSLQSDTVLDDADMEHEALLFGKLNLEEKFSMDIRWPLSPIQGFAVCMSAFDPKLATE